MDRKVHPNDIRLDIVRPQNSTWFVDTKEFADNLDSDFEVRQSLARKLARASVSRIVVKRPAKNTHVTIHTACPGIVTDKEGEGIEKLRKIVVDIVDVSAQINIVEIHRLGLDAKLVTDSIVSRLERHVMFRRAVRHVVQNAMRLGAKGIKTEISGRLGGVETARTKQYREGRAPPHIPCTGIDCNISEVHTTYDMIGIEVRTLKGEILGGMAAVEQPEPATQPKK